MLLTYSGRPRDALQRPGADSVSSPSPRARALPRRSPRCRPSSPIGRCETAVEQASRAFAELIELPDQIAIAGPGCTSSCRSTR